MLPPRHAPAGGDSACRGPGSNRDHNTRELVIMGHLGWDGMMFLNLETGEYEPLLATTGNGSTAAPSRVNLREGVIFHDGSSFRPDDVVYTVNHVADPSKGVITQANVNWMESAEQTGPNTVRIPDLLRRLADHDPRRALFSLVLAINLLGDGIRDVTAPGGRS